MMKRLVLLMLLDPLSARAQMIQGLVNDSTQAAPPSGCSQATTFIARTSGLSGTESTAITTMICGMVTDGTWSLMDAMYIFATNTTTTANLNLISTSFTLTSHNTPTFTADQGYTGSTTVGTGGLYLDTSYTPISAAGNCSLNSCSIGSYNRTNRTTPQAAFIDTGVQNSTGTTTNLSVAPNVAGTTAFADVNDFTFPTNAVTTSQGFLMGVRNGSSTTIQYYKNGATLGAAKSATSKALPTGSVFILGINITSTSGVSDPSSDQIAAVFIGGGLTSTQAGNVSSRINDYMTAVGANVY